MVGLTGIVFIIAILVVIGLPIATVLVITIFSIKRQHNERMALISQGIVPPNTPQKKPIPNRLVSLRNGTVLVSLAVGLLIGLLITEYWIINDDMQFWIIGSSVTLFLGIGYLIYYMFTRNTLPIQDENIEEEK